MKLKITVSKLAEYICEVAVDGKLKTDGACNLLESKIAKYGVKVPTSLKENAIRLAKIKINEARLPTPEDASNWGGDWDGEVSKNLRLWRGVDSGREPKPNMPVIRNIKYMYHGTSLANALKLLSTGTRKIPDGGNGLNITADLDYAKSYARWTLDDEPNLVLAIVAIPTNLIDWSKATMSDNWDDLANAQVFNAIPGSKLKVAAIGALPKKLQQIKKKPLK